MGGLAGAPGGSSEVMDISNVTWRKASYSGANGGECVEVGVWRKASYSGGNGGECVEVASAGKAVVAVRDSKDSDGPKLAFTPSVWQSFVQQMRNRVSDAS
jgi:hypothetical protein